MSDRFCGIPCVQCIVYAACRCKNSIKCEILHKHYRKKFPLLMTSNDRMCARMQITDYLIYLNKNFFFIFNDTIMLNN